MTNWNNGVAHGFGAADNEWMRNGAVGRIDLLDKNLARLVGGDGKWSLAEVTSAMNAGGTQDIRAIDTVPLLRKLLKGSEAPSPRAQQMLDLMVSWRNAGGSRLDLDLDGEIDDPGAAVMDGSWSNIADAFMTPRLGTQLDELATLVSRFDLPPSGQYSGWYQYFDRDIKSLLGIRQPAPLREQLLRQGQAEGLPELDLGGDRGLGRGDRGRAGDRGSGRLALRRAARADQVQPAAVKTMRYTNRPSGIQQVISFKGHRPKKK